MAKDAQKARISSGNGVEAGASNGHSLADGMGNGFEDTSSLNGNMGADLWVCGPATLCPAGLDQFGVHATTSVEEAVEGADVVMMLRIQNERMHGHFIPSVREYFALFGMTPARLRRAQPDVILMHPGPMNRGVEIDSEVADGPYSVILEQVANGVAVRMTVTST